MGGCSFSRAREEGTDAGLHLILWGLSGFSKGIAEHITAYAPGKGELVGRSRAFHRVILVEGLGVCVSNAEEDGYHFKIVGVRHKVVCHVMK